jgi:hypothetical protein
VIEQVTRQKLPEGFQTAEFLLEHGMIDGIIDRNALRDTLTRLSDHYVRRPDHDGTWHPKGLVSDAPPLPEPEPVATDAGGES